MKLTELLDQIDRLDAELKQPVAHDQISFSERLEREDELAYLGMTKLPQLAKALQAVIAHLGQLEVKYDDYNAIDHIVHSITHELRQAIRDSMGDDDAE